jgi:hypothetical protein
MEQVASPSLGGLSSILLKFSKVAPTNHLYRRYLDDLRVMTTNLEIEMEGIEHKSKTKASKDAEIDLLEEYFQERLTRSGMEKISDLYSDYSYYCSNSGRDPVTNNKLGRFLIGKGIEKKHLHSAWYYQGISLKPSFPKWKDRGVRNMEEVLASASFTQQVDVPDWLSIDLKKVVDSLSPVSQDKIEDSLDIYQIGWKMTSSTKVFSDAVHPLALHYAFGIDKLWAIVDSGKKFTSVDEINKLHPYTLLR